MNTKLKKILYESIMKSVAKTVKKMINEDLDVDDENLMVWEDGYTNDDLYGYEIVTWPDVQLYMELPGFDENAYLINDEEGMDLFGGSAYVIDEDWLDSVC